MKENKRGALKRRKNGAALLLRSPSRTTIDLGSILNVRIEVPAKIRAPLGENSCTIPSSNSTSRPGVVLVNCFVLSNKECRSPQGWGISHSLAIRYRQSVSETVCLSRYKVLVIRPLDPPRAGSKAGRAGARRLPLSMRISDCRFKAEIRNRKSAIEEGLPENINDSWRA